ncbi:MAG TPA: pilus assembly protein PilM [Candidatus Omnitrophota bacterium]|nr:pilus assembly protein PilM [Candidatus Omnitrophota bacterium]
MPAMGDQGISAKSKKLTIVVEIGNDWLKILEYSFARKGGCITRASFVKLVQIKESVAEALAKAFKALKLGKRGVIVCIPRHLVTVRILEFPSTDPKEIHDMVALQVGKQTPYSREEIIFAYRLIRVVREGYMKVMLVIARRNIVNARIDVLQKSGIEVETVAVSSEGVFHWFNAAYPSEIKASQEGITEGTVLIDIDSNYSDFLVISKGQFCYTRNILIGANHLLEDDGKWKDKFIEEVSHSMELYRNEDPHVKLSKVFLTGTAKHIKGLDQGLMAQVDLPVAVTEPLNNIKTLKDVRAFRSDDAVFVSPSPLVGMAVNNKDLQLDLTSRELRIQKDMDQKRKQIMVMGVLAASIVMIGSLLLLISLYSKNAYLTQLEREIKKIEKVANLVDRMRQHITLVKERLDAGRRSINISDEIHKLTPKEICFTNINIEEDSQTVLQGRAKEMSNVFSFVTVLENSPYFENVKTTYTTTKKEQGEEYTKFEIICLYERKEEFEE